MWPTLAWTGSEYGLVQVSGHTGMLFLTRLDPTGTPIGNDVQVVPTQGNISELHPSLLWNGSDYALVWLRAINQGIVRLYFERLTPQGAPLTGSLPVSSDYVLENGGYETGVQAVWTGAEYGVAWKLWENGAIHIYLARISPSGQKIGPDRLLASTPNRATNFSLLWTGSEYALAWTDVIGGNYELDLGRFDVTGTSLGPVARLANSGFPWDPALAWNGVGFSFTFRAYRDSNSDIYFGREACTCVDGDGDGFTSCSDCDDTRPEVHPGAIEVCNGLDDDCNGLVDDGLGVTSCGLGACARTVSSCFRTLTQSCVPFSPAPEIRNGIDDDCNGTIDDTPDTLIVLSFLDRASLAWAHGSEMGSFNVYRGNLSVLKNLGLYTQDPDTTPLASRVCGVPAASTQDAEVPPPGAAFFYLVTAVAGGNETDLGVDSAGRVRANANPCP